MTASISKEMSPPTLRRKCSVKYYKIRFHSLSIVVVSVVKVHKIILKIAWYEYCRFIYDDVIEFMPITLHKLSIHSVYIYRSKYSMINCSFILALG